MKNKLFNIYLRSPYWVQLFSINIYGIYISFKRYVYPYKVFFDFNKSNDSSKVNFKQANWFIVPAKSLQKDLLEFPFIKKIIRS